MNISSSLREAEPLCGDWYIKSYDGEIYGIKRYTVCDRIGCIADMYLAVLPEGEKADSFFQTMSLVKRLSQENSNFLRMYGFGSQKSEQNRLDVYIIYEKAESLSDKLQKTRLNSELILNMASDIADALRVCEDNSLCHGNISYENIYFTGGKYKLGKFGEAELLKVMGLYNIYPNYCVAPEFSQGKCDIRSDIYSLGIIVYGLYNFGRLPFAPSKPESYILLKCMEIKAFKERMNAKEVVFPKPLYADQLVIEFINKCCAFEPENRYSSIVHLADDVEAIKKNIDLKRNIEYPNFTTVKTNNYMEAGSVYKDERKDFSDQMTEKIINKESQNFANEDENVYTMGAQSFYNEAMRNIRSNRHIKVDESILQDIEKTEQRLAKKYGIESPQYLKFIEKVRMLENSKDSLEQLKCKNKKLKLLIGTLAGMAAAAVIAGIVIALNTNTFYINQGQYNNIYRRNMFGTVECFKDVSAKNLLKDGTRLYYINADDNKIYSTSAKKGTDEELITENETSAFKIANKYIYYINISDAGKLYRVSTDGYGEECISEDTCISVSNNKKNIEFINESEPESPKLYDVRTGTIKDAFID